MDGLWGGRFEGGMADAMAALNGSLSVDCRLWSQDIRGSKAWAEALVRARVLTPEEGESILSGLDAVAEKLARFDFSGAEDEDIHTLVERLLKEEIGPVAGKLHTGRSRNDQVATDFRLWGMEAAEEILTDLDSLLRSLISLAESGLDIILPGHTHLQQAQPIRAAHWVLSHFWPLTRDRERVCHARVGADSLPLGSGALAGCPFPVDREFLRKTLGFRSILENSLDAVSDRDWVAEMLFAGALLGVHLSRFAEDLVVFSSREFGYLELPEGFCTGSSLMPQKRNPDAAELVRGKAGRLLGNHLGILTLLKGLPAGYNRDLQEDKGFLFDTVDTLGQVLPVMTGVAVGTKFRADSIAARLDPGLLATDLADYLVRKGVPFREAHEAVGALVRESEIRGESLADLPLETFREVNSAFDKDLVDVFSFETSVEARSETGGTGRKAVVRQLEAARATISG